MVDSRPHIMVINDEPCSLRNISRVLRATGYRTSLFLEARQALQALEHGERLDLIVTDLNMPELDGWSLCRQLRSPRFAQHNETPILVTSATFAANADTGWASGLGANATLSVPFSAEVLRARVAELLRGAHPRSTSRVLLAGYPSDCPEAGLFRRHGYTVETATLTQASSAPAADVLIVRSDPGDLEAAELLSGALGQTRVLVLTAPAPAETLLWYRRGCLVLDAWALPELLVEACERARHQAGVLVARALLEERTRELEGSESGYHELFESVPDLAMLLSETGQILRLNESGALMLGCQSVSLIGRHLRDLVQTPSCSHTLEAALQEARLFGQVQCELRLQEPEVELELRLRLLRNGGEPVLLAIGRDVRERIRAQEAVMLSDTRYRIIAEKTYDWEFWISPGGHFLYSSPACERVTGYQAEDFEVDDGLLARLVHPEDREEFAAAWMRLGEDSQARVEFDFRLQHHDGSLRWISHVSQPVYDDMEHFLGSRGSHRDVTERRQVQEERELLAAAVRHSLEAILLTDAEGRLTYANPAFESGSGYTRQGVLGRTPEFLYGDEYAAIKAALAQGRPWSGVCHRSHLDGTSCEVELSVSPVLDARNIIRNYVWMERNVTRERRLQAQLRQAQKMEAIGTLAGGIAHDFNNMLSGILGYAGMLKLNASSGGEIFRSADVIERTALRAADLTQKLLGFARQGKHQHVSVNVHQTIGDVLELLSRTIDKTINISVSPCHGHMTVMGDPGQLEQILLNLAINARDAMPDGGHLTFETGVETLPEGLQLDSGVVESRGDYVVIRVKDTGTGIPDDVRARIFEPFFTTKPAGKGTGMGLAMVYGIVKNHNGFLRLDSVPGEGSTFSVYLQAAPSVRKAEAATVKPIRGSGRVLVVDDEELIRDMTRRMLTHLGYEVLTAADGREAIDVYSGTSEGIDLVIMDMMMPGMTGRECFFKLRAINPNVRVILSTGYSVNESAQHLLDHGLVGFIQKPYQVSQLSEVVANSITPLSRAS